MPSPTLSTWPTSLTCASAPKFWISRLRIAEISAGWISILLSSHGGAKPFELRAQRRIDHARSDLHDEATEKGRIDFGVKLHIEIELGFENAFEFGGLGVAQRSRGCDMRGGLAAHLRDQHFETADDVGEDEQAALRGQCQHELHGERGGFDPAQDRVHALFLLVARKH